METKVPALVLAALLAASDGAAQESSDRLLREALVVAGAPGYPEVVTVNDPVQAAVVNGTWRAPRAGERVRYSDTASASWERVRADSQGWFEHQALRSGYLSAAVESGSAETVLIEGMGHTMVYVNGEPRSGNPYGSKDVWEEWEPRFDYSSIPIRLQKGTNQLLFVCTRGRLKVRLARPRAEALLNTRDLTLPDLIEGAPLDAPGAVAVANCSGRSLRGATLRAVAADGTAADTPVPELPPLSIRKAVLRLRAGALRGRAPVLLSLLSPGGRPLDTATVVLRVRAAGETRKETFVSGIDGSVQYYAITPAAGADGSERPALVLSLHGAAVEAVNQASSYEPRRWAHIVAPTNRRPYGFNWEEWGRIDALEALAAAKSRHPIDESRVYLTGHSMGGHGAYHLGSLYPDQFAAIAPSAGWVSFWTYRVREVFRDPSPVRQMLMRATLPSDTYTMAVNFRQLGVYILHGAADDNVPVEQSRSMARHLAAFHRDFVYHEQPGAGHWWDGSPAPGADCVDWPPLFDFLARHARPLPGRARRVEFATPFPAVSSRCQWVTVEQQAAQCRLSTVSLQCDPGLRRVAGSVSNVMRFSVDAAAIFTPGPVTVLVDSQAIENIPWPKEGEPIWLELRQGRWAAVPRPSPASKGPHRSGTFKEAIRNRVVFVYGTKGSDEENRWALGKARFDAERFWYQGNGSIDLVADAEFDPAADRDRNVVLYGNARTNGAWASLLGREPVEVGPGRVRVGGRVFPGQNLCAVFVRPRPGSDSAIVGAVAGTGLAGMRLTDRLPYLIPGAGFPDLLVCSTEILRGREEGVLWTGFFGNDWSEAGGEFAGSSR